MLPEVRNGSRVRIIFLIQRREVVHVQGHFILSYTMQSIQYIYTIYKAYATLCRDKQRGNRVFDRLHTLLFTASIIYSYVLSLTPFLYVLFYHL